MSCGGAIDCDPVTDHETVFVQSDADGCISFVSDISLESVAMLTSDTASPGTETVINQCSSLDIPHSSVAEAVDFGTDLTVLSMSPVTKKNILPLRVSRSQSEEQNVVVYEVILNGSGF